jgi:hypothetical protein
VQNWTLLTSAPESSWLSPATPASGCAHRRPAGHHRAQHLRHRDRPDPGAYVAKHKDGRRNRYQIQAHLPLPEPASPQAPTGKLLDLLISRRETTDHN